MRAFDWRDRAVLVTGGTRGIGLETALAFGRAGARVIVTYRWGGSEAAALARFQDEGLPAPRIARADVADAAQTTALLTSLRSDYERIDGFVSNVAMAAQVRGLDDYKLRGLTRSIEYTAWPLVAYTRGIHEIFGAWPRYVVGVSSLGVGQIGLHYDFVAASKAVLETFIRYLAWRLGPEGVRVNGVTAGPARTESAIAIAGPELGAFLEWHEAAIGPIPFVRPEHVAGAIFALCGGWLDGLNGQILTVDDGSSTFACNRFGLFLSSLEPSTPTGEGP